ncbi:hypothetical protein ACFSKW_50380 [Nonomuraea mangrovi]|uniref:Uncharacterized protein n=1 Tax=Nonomuraea mangrovi TaxID=2316207 RepID=A0ABW4TCD9_9ACTN
MTYHEVEQALAQVERDEKDIAANLLNVDRHMGYRLLDGGELTGLTAER